MNNIPCDSMHETIGGDTATRAQRLRDQSHALDDGRRVGGRALCRCSSCLLRGACSRLLRTSPRPVNPVRGGGFGLRYTMETMMPSPNHIF